MWELTTRPAGQGHKLHVGIATMLLLVTAGLAQSSWNYTDDGFDVNMINRPTPACSVVRGCPKAAVCWQMKLGWSKCVCPADTVLLHEKCSKLNDYRSALARCSNPPAGSATRCDCPDQSVPAADLCAAALGRRGTADECNVVSDGPDINVTSSVLTTFTSGCRRATEVYPMCFRKALRFARGYRAWIGKSAPYYDLTRMAYAVLQIVPIIGDEEDQEMLQTSLIVSAVAAYIHRVPERRFADIFTVDVPSYWGISRREITTALKGVQADATAYNATMNWLSNRLCPPIDGRVLATRFTFDREAAATSLVYVLKRAFCYNHKTRTLSDDKCLKNSFDRQVKLWTRVLYLLPWREPLRNLLWNHESHSKHNYKLSSLHKCLQYRLMRMTQYSIFDVGSEARYCLEKDPDVSLQSAAGALNNPGLPFVSRKDSVANFIDPVNLKSKGAVHAGYRRRFDPHEIIVEYLEHVRLGSFDKMDVHVDEVASTTLGLLDLRRYSTHNSKGLYYLALRLALAEQVTFNFSIMREWPWLVERSPPKAPGEKYNHDYELAELTGLLYEWYEMCVADAEAVVMTKTDWRPVL